MNKITTTTTEKMALQDLINRQARGQKIIVCFGGGRDSTAMLIALHRANVTPDLITFADTGAEKMATYNHVRFMDTWLKAVGFPQVTWCKKLTLASTSYTDLGGNCTDNETLPSLAFGMKSCSIKWKQTPQDYFVMGCKRGPNKCEAHPLWVESQRTGIKPLKLIGYDHGPADLRRSAKVKTEDANFEYSYPLQDLGWTLPQCIEEIQAEGLPVPVKSACYFCPASHKWELFHLAATEPHLFMNALAIERKALTGRHSRFDEVVDFIGWEEMIATYDSYPSFNTCVGLGRSFSWNHFARLNNIIDASGKFIANRARCLAISEELKSAGNNAVDARTCGGSI